LTIERLVQSCLSIARIGELVIYSCKFGYNKSKC